MRNLISKSDMSLASMIEDILTIQSMVNNWQVVLDGVCSDPAPVLSGVPQSSVLGPLLFLIFINNLPDNINSTVCLFTDDCVLSSSVTQVWSITLHFIHHPWDNWLTKRRFLWIFITPGNTSIANQNVANIALLSSAEDSFVVLPLLKITQENPINVFVSN